MPYSKNYKIFRIEVYVLSYLNYSCFWIAHCFAFDIHDTIAVFLLLKSYLCNTCSQNTDSSCSQCKNIQEQYQSYDLKSKWFGCTINIPLTNLLYFLKWLYVPGIGWLCLIFSRHLKRVFVRFLSFLSSSLDISLFLFSVTTSISTWKDKKVL